MDASERIARTAWTPPGPRADGRGPGSRREERVRAERPRPSRATRRIGASDLARRATKEPSGRRGRPAMDGRYLLAKPWMAEHRVRRACCGRKARLRTRLVNSYRASFSRQMGVIVRACRRLRNDLANWRLLDLLDSFCNSHFSNLQFANFSNFFDLQFAQFANATFRQFALFPGNFAFFALSNLHFFDLQFAFAIRAFCNFAICNLQFALFRFAICNFSIRNLLEFFELAHGFSVFAS